MCPPHIGPSSRPSSASSASVCQLCAASWHMSRHTASARPRTIRSTNSTTLRTNYRTACRPSGAQEPGLLAQRALESRGQSTRKLTVRIKRTMRLSSWMYRRRITHLIGLRKGDGRASGRAQKQPIEAMFDLAIEYDFAYQNATLALHQRMSIVSPVTPMPSTVSRVRPHHNTWH
jgi:hypothetical protein